MKLKVNKKFKELLPQKTPEEKKALEAILLNEGIRDPIVYWQETGDILDGHNRFDIATRKDLTYTTKRMSFKDEDAAIEWIVNNQLHGRRNLTDEERTYFIGKLYLARVQQVGGQKPTEEGVGHGDPPGTNTADKVAAETGVSPRTVKRAAVFAEAVDELPKDTKTAVLKGDEALPKPKGRKRKKPKAGSERFKQREFEKDWGRMLRWIDILARGYDLVTRGGAIKETPEVLGLQRKLKDWKKDFLALQKELEQNQLKSQKEAS